MSKPTPWVRRLARWAVMLPALMILAGGPVSPAAQEALPAPPRLAQIYAPTSQERTALAALGLDIFNADEQGIVARLTPAQSQAIIQQGYVIRFLPATAAIQVDKSFHYYYGAMDRMRQVVAAYPQITRQVSLGATEGGLPIYALNISAQPDSAKPGVLIFALTHAREHLTVEMALFIINFLTQEYGHTAAVTNLVNERDIWIIPVLNPDGEMYDVQTGYYQYWRKNRRPNPNGSFGVDLNRNFGYRWGCCGGSSGNPGDMEYRGPAPFSEIETTLLRQFVEARPHLTTSLSLHTYSELVLWPYGYTTEALPPDMNAGDYAAFVALGQEMARRNGYRAMQASDLYITDGGSDDWLYAERGIFAFTMEMYPRYSNPGFYPPGNIIARETERNRSAVEYLLGMADYPRRAAGAGGDIIPPQVSLTEPGAGARPPATLTLRALAQDNVAVTLVEFLVDGASIALDAQSPFETRWTPPTTGVFTLQARAFDAAQNIGTSTVVTTLVGLPQALPLIQTGSH